MTIKSVFIKSFFLLFLPCLTFPHSHSLQLIKSEGNTPAERISVPPEFERITAEKGSFTDYLRNYPFKEAGSLMFQTDCPQSTQSVIRLYSEYLLKTGNEDKISFHLTNGEICSWSEWLKNSKFKRNERTEIAGNLKKWTKYENPQDKYEIYNSYLKNVFANTSPLSIMEYESRQISLSEAIPGDILFDLDQNGHICLIIDMAVNKKNGEKAFLLAQNSSTSRKFHIIKNPKRANDPWFHEEDFILPLKTPEHTFPRESFRHLTYLEF